MEMRSRARATTAIVVNQMMTPSPKHQDLHQKVSLFIGDAQSPSKLQPPFFVVEGYYSSYSSSPSLKQASNQ